MLKKYLEKIRHKVNKLKHTPGKIHRYTDWEGRIVVLEEIPLEEAIKRLRIEKPEEFEDVD